MPPNKGNAVVIDNDAIVSSDSEESLDESQITLTSDNPSISSLKWKDGITVEPMLFLHYTAYSCCLVNVQSFYIDAICQQQYPSNTSICSNLKAFKHEEEVVEAIAATYFSFKGLIEAGLPILFALFLGAWCDKHGSKTPMVLSLSGCTFSAFLFMIFSKMPNIHPAIFLIASVPISLSGGMTALTLSFFRYISEISTVENRSFRIAIAQGAWLLGGPVGFLGSIQILKYTDYTTVFMTATVLYSLSVLYTVFVVRNDKTPDLETNSETSIFGDIFNVAAVQSTFETCFRKRTGNQRMWIMILFFNFGLITLAYGGFNILFLYTRIVLDWDAETYSVYATADGIIGAFGAILGPVLLINYFRLSDNVLVLFTSMSYVIGVSMYMIASQSWMMYFGSCLQIICSLTALSIRSMLSKLVSSEEHGKIFSFLACFDAGMPILGNFLYNFVFEESMFLEFPYAVYLLSVCLYIIVFLLFVFLLFAMKLRNAQHELLEEDC